MSARQSVADRAVDKVMGPLTDELQDVLAGQLRTPTGTWSARHFVPKSARATSRRLFVEVVVDGIPRWIAKVPLNDYDSMVDREWDVLVNDTWQHPAFAMPRPVARLSRGFLMSWLPQVDFPDHLARPDVDAAAVVQRAASAVAEMHLASSVAVGAADDTVRRHLGPRAIEVPERCWRVLRDARAGHFHGDLGPWNLRIGVGETLGLVDWEDRLVDGVQGIDVLNLTLTAVVAANAHDRDRTGDSLVGEMLDPRTGMGRTIVASLQDYATATEQDPVAIGELVAVFCLWMDERIRRQGRKTSHLFYRPLARHFADRRREWLMELSREQVDTTD